MEVLAERQVECVLTWRQMGQLVCCPAAAVSLVSVIAGRPSTAALRAAIVGELGSDRSFFFF
jgi:hypothetical protein